MSKKKHIDELFKEQFQNFEVAPSPDIWNNIQAKMKKEEKEDRKVIPIWWKLGGVAAALALLLALNFVFKPFGENTEPVLVNEDKTDTPLKEDTHSPVIDESTFDKDAISSEMDKEESMDDQVDKAPLENDAEKTLKSKITDESKNDRKAVVAETETNSSKFKTGVEKNKKINSVETISKKDAIGVTSEKDDPIQNKTKDINPLIKKDVSEGVETNVTTGVAKTANKTKDINEKKGDETLKTTEGSDVLIKKDISEINNTTEKIADVDNKKQDEVDEISDSEENKKSIFDAIEENKEEAVAAVDTGQGKNWEVTPNFGPVFYNSLNGGSSIDPSFADNSQSGDINFSYGVQVSYAINDRLSLRSGVSNVELGYTTGGVELATGPVEVALSSIDYGGRRVVLSAFDKGTLASAPLPQGEGDPFNGLTPKSTSGNAELIQNLSYYEVPLELKYALLNKRFGVNMIGGFSTLFLGDNEVSVQDGSFRDVLGAANNLNSVSFSTNVGLGFDYKISKRLKFNVEPMFKYQLNPYTDSSVDFRPYYFGVYSGLSFKF
ncbi:MAG: outer membrane beta-barrel protein [Bacteroidota bacterium]